MFLFFVILILNSIKVLYKHAEYGHFQLKEDPSFKPQGGRLGENDMEYDTDEKSMATLRRHLRGAREEYYRYKRLANLFIEYLYCIYNT